MTGEGVEVTDSCISIKYSNIVCVCEDFTKLAQPMPKSKAMDGYKQEKDIIKCGVNEANGRYLARLPPRLVAAILGQDLKRKSLREKKKATDGEKTRRHYK